MHVECSACGARYTIADEKIPAQGARVRCRKCQQVFAISRPAAPPVPVEIPVIPPTPEPAMPPPSPTPPTSPTPASSLGSERTPSFASSAQQTFDRDPYAAPQPEPWRQPAAPQAAPAPQQHVAPAPQPAPSAPSGTLAFRAATSTGIPEGLPEAERVKHERARRLARVLASDIAIYNKEKRDRGIRDGNLVAVLGYEIKKSWEVYKERITPELANSTPYFRDALNEIVAEGMKIF